MSQEEEGSNTRIEKRYKGIRRRKWGKWVSEIRVPGTKERLWLGSYSTPEAAAISYDTALFCLRGTSVADRLNFPMCLPPFLQVNMSPKSIQKAASDAGMAIDAELKALMLQGNNMKEIENEVAKGLDTQIWENGCSEFKEEDIFSISIEDMEIYL